MDVDNQAMPMDAFNLIRRIRVQVAAEQACSPNCFVKPVFATV